MKKFFKSFIVGLLTAQVRRLINKNRITIIGVVGSTGKTSTKSAISTVLSHKLRVRYQAGNYNDITTVPLVFFGEELPPLMNPVAWGRLLLRNERAIARPYEFDVVVLELGTDAPGQIREFKECLKLDHAVVTALTPEHMENFDSLEAVVDEELSVQEFSNSLLINTDLSPVDVGNKIKIDFRSYGKDASDFLIKNITRSGWDVVEAKDTLISIKRGTISDAEVYSISAAAILAAALGLTSEEIQSGIKSVNSMSGRMNVLKGKNESIIIDDSYNASPAAMIQAIEALINYKSKHKIALLGNMNELGKSSAQLHESVGAHCSDQIDLIITLGKDANKYLAEAAEKKGCRVMRTDSPYDAGKTILEELKPGTAVLIKGSQNGVYSEEAIKCLLADQRDEQRLVRQSPEWLKKKNKQFGVRP